MSDLITDFSVAPYHDDYERDKQFYRILFLPKKAVQIREITQMQTMVQEQIRRFGDHIFKDGSIVAGCAINHVPKMEYVRLDNGWNNAFVANNAFDSNLQNMLLVSNTGVRASVRLAKQGYVNRYPDTNVLYIDYIASGTDGANNQVDKFTSGETLTVYSTEQPKFDTILDSNKVYNSIEVLTANVVANQSSIGTTYAVSVGEGVIYQKGFFISVVPHTITVKPYDTDVNDYFVGFNTNEFIVTHLQDQSLLDPVINNNSNAPGADRLKLNPVLISKHKSEIVEDDDFFPIVVFNEQNPVIQKTDPEYAKLGDALAIRTDESAGSFYTTPFTVSTEATSNTATFKYTVSPGVGYVKGSRVELINTLRMETPRAQNTDSSQANIVTMNYGYYVLVNELVGMFDYDQMTSVNLYDTAQTTITQVEGSGAAPSGTIVGTANVRHVVYDSGVKGSPSAVFRVYLSNITMLTGKSFATHAKSLHVAGAFGSAKADLILEASKAVLKDSGRSSLIFPTGMEGLKRLTDENGVNDTQFYVRDIVSATMQSNGTATFTLNSPHAGGNERFFSSVGALSNANELRVDVVFSNSAYTSALTGTVNSTTTGNTLTGTGTTFTTQYAVGEMIRVSANTTNHFHRTVMAIANNTSLTVNGSFAGGNAVASHAKYYQQGHVLNLANGVTVTALSNTQFTVDIASTTLAAGAPQTVYASFPVLRTQAVPARKSVKRNRFVKINCSNNAATSVGPWTLGVTDAIKINKVYVGATYANTNPDRTEWFSLDTGQSPTEYGHAKLTVKPAFRAQLSSASRLLIDFDHYSTSTTAGVGFFSVDSYPVRNPGDAANTTNVSYAEIPIFDGQDLRNCIDFRPMRTNTAADANTEAGASTNPLNSTTYSVAGSGLHLAEPDTNFQADAEYFLPRIDLVQVNRDGVFNIKSSVSQLNPKTPVADQEAMPVAGVYVPPYPSLTAGERTLYGNARARIEPKLLGNRGYTMKDINGLDQRITRLEYYQLLSALETAAKDFNVKDENGLDRFKNGIFADPFNNHQLGDVSNFEYAIAIDQQNGIARPKIERNPIDLKVANTTNAVTSGNVLTLPHSPLLMIQQPSASKVRNATESVWNWRGTLQMFPSYDHFRDESAVPDVNVTIDTASPWEEFADSPFGMNFGDWRTVATGGGQTGGGLAGTRFGNMTGGGITATGAGGTTITTTTVQERIINELVVQNNTTTHDLGSYVTDFSINPFMRSREVALIINGLKPNTNFWVYFDRVDVSAHCAPATANLSNLNTVSNTTTVTSGGESAVLTRTSNWGTQLVSDATGNLMAMLRIPAETFRVGDREILVANVDDIEIGTDAITSSARATYTASSMTLSTRSINLNVIEPDITTTQRIETQSTTTTVTFPNPVPAPGGGFGGQGAMDPLGQSFLVDIPPAIPGTFLEKIGVYFRTKDANLGITLVLAEVTAGIPDRSKIIARSYLKPSAISTSVDATAETVFEFGEMPYLTAAKYYAFYLQPDGNSPEYLVYMAEIGGTDITTGIRIFSNPYIGVAYTSANAETWTPLQTEDIKFNIYRAQFTSLVGTATFVDQDDEYLTVNGFTMSNNYSDLRVGDVVYSQNSTGGLLTSNASPFGVIQQFDIASNKLILDGSRGGIVANTTLQIHRPSDTSNVAVLNANTMVANATVVTVDNYTYSMVVPRIGTITPFGTNIDFTFRGMDSGENYDPAYVPIQPETEREFIDRSRMIKSRSNRLAIDHSAGFIATLVSPTDYLTPVIDLRRRTALFVKNIINDDVTNEHTRYGSALVKYVSKRIVLAEGQDAEDIRVLVTGYRPPESEISCYVKFLNAEDSDNFEDKLWTKLTMSAGASIFSNVSDPEDYREFQFSLPTVEAQVGEAYTNALNTKIMEYRNAANGVFVGYKTFAIKLVLTSAREERVPKMRDVRSIALQI